MNGIAPAFLAALLLAFPLAAASPAAKAVEVDLSVATKPWKGDLDGMLRRRIIRALVPYSQTFYFVVNGTPRGIAYESLKAFEEFVNRRHPPKQKHLGARVVFLPVPRDEILTRLEQGFGDVAVAGLAVTSERREKVDFSLPTAGGIDEIVVTGPESPILASLADLAGRDVFVRRSSSAWEHLQQLNDRFRKEGKKPVGLRAAPEDLEEEDILEMLDAGLIPASVMYDFVPKLWAHIYTRARAHPGAVLHADDEFAWALRKGSPQFREIVDEFLRAHGKGTAFGNTLLQRYMESDRMVRNATSVAERDKFDRTIELFRKYGDRYGIDYLLMVSQGYQESGLDQNVKSRVGAIGVMQLMPATGRQMKVGDIRELEPNIHAGVKYVRFMMDQYWAGEPMDALNKVLFSFASYNAGPGRIQELRRIARKKGLNPDVWAANVQLVAAERIGMETVTYVSNIYKYYVAYKLLLELQDERKKELEAFEKAKGGGRN